MKLIAKQFPSVLLKLMFLAACLLLLSSYQPYKRLWQLADLEPFTEWFQINWQGQVVGWSKKQLEIDDNFYKFNQSELFEGRIRGKRVKFVYENSFYFDKEFPYQLKKGEAKLVEPELTMKTSFENGEQLVIRQQRNQSTEVYTEPELDFTLNQFLALRQFIESQPEKGTSVEGVVLDPHSVELSHKQYELIKIPEPRHQNYQLADRSDPTSFSMLQFDRKGNILGEYRNRGIELIASRQKPSFNPEMQRDLYSATGIAVNQPLGKLEQIQQLALAFEGLQLAIHPSASVKNNLLMTRPSTHYQASAQEREQWQFYRPTPSVSALNPEVNQNASALTKVKTLVNFVHDYLYYQPTPTGFTIDEVIANGYGDCTEYTQLLLALLNAEQIPAREVSGYIYLGDDEQRFGGHAWVEVLIDDQWVGVDPTWNLTQTTAGHLPITIVQNTIAQEKQLSDLVFTVQQIHYK